MNGDRIGDALTRRGFLAAAGAGAVTLAEALSLTRAAATAAASVTDVGALLPTDAAVRRTIAAYADTIVPGPAGGADPAPGAIEAGALDVIYDPAYGATVVLPVLHEDLQLASIDMLGRPFDLSVPYRDRERVVIDRLKSTGRYGMDGNGFILVYAGVAVITYVAYYGTARSTLGPRYIGFPTSSRGYRHHSYHLRFRGMTKDGNPR